jgi:hypothetical protein
MFLMLLEKWRATPYSKVLPCFLLIIGTILMGSAYIFLIYRLNSRLEWHDKSEFSLHLLISSGILLLLVWVFSLIVTSRISPSSSVIRYIFTVSISFYFLFLSIFYPLSLSANFFWGDNITLNLISRH